jgi:hypothetical protein
LTALGEGNVKSMSELTEPPSADNDADPAADLDEEDKGLLDRLRGTGVGVEDPNIVGDAGPTDIPPGRDPGSDGLFADPADAEED